VYERRLRASTLTILSLKRVAAGDAIVPIAVGAITALTLLMVATASAARPCLTEAEAHEQWPKAHLFWHTANHCWDNLPLNAVRATDYDKPKLQSTPVASAQMVASPEAAEPEIFFPTVRLNSADFFGLGPAPQLSWSVPWFAPAPIASWPPLLDIDRMPFITWERRVGR
jgi:hypothetical protein